MRITLVFEVLDPDDVDPSHRTGLTEAAYGRLSDAVTDEGFEIYSGPDKIEDSD